jgi:hypothetical protein
VELSLAAELIPQADLNSSEIYCSLPDARDTPGGKNSWFCYDFKKRRVVLTHHSIRTSPTTTLSSEDGSLHHSIKGWHLKSWAIEVSVHGDKCEEIDRRENTSNLNGPDILKTFRGAKSQTARAVRVISIGTNYAGNEAIAIAAFEVFGSLME